MKNIKIAHRDAKTWQDKWALGFMRIARWGMDLVTGYSEKTGRVDENGVYSRPKGWRVMDERKWLIRIVFLESIAGVPGMVGGMLRHLHSLRRLKRDNGWSVILRLTKYGCELMTLTGSRLSSKKLTTSACTSSPSSSSLSPAGS